MLLPDNVRERLRATFSRDDLIAHRQIFRRPGCATLAPVSSRKRLDERNFGYSAAHEATRYRCSLPGLAGFAGNRCTEPEVPPIGSHAAENFPLQDCFAESSTPPCTAKAGAAPARADGDASYEPSRLIFAQPFAASMYLIARVQPPHPHRGASGKPHETGQASLSGQATEGNMKRIVSVCAAVSLLLLLFRRSTPNPIKWFPAHKCGSPC